MIQSEQETFNFYMIEFPITRKRYGIGRDKQGRYYVEDQEIIDKLHEGLKSMLRSFCVEMKRRGKWIATPKELNKIYWE